MDAVFSVSNNYVSSACSCWLVSARVFPQALPTASSSGVGSRIVGFDTDINMMSGSVHLAILCLRGLSILHAKTRGNLRLQLAKLRSALLRLYTSMHRIVCLTEHVKPCIIAPLLLNF